MNERISRVQKMVARLVGGYCTWITSTTFMNLKSFVEMDALLLSLHQNHDIGFLVIGKDVVGRAFDIMIYLKKEIWSSRW